MKCIDFIAFDARTGHLYRGSQEEFDKLEARNQDTNLSIHGEGPIAEAYQSSKFSTLARGVLSAFNLAPKIKKAGVTVISFDHRQK